MRIYFAPLEGITDAIFRQCYQACFGGVDKYFMPFVSPSQALSYTVREEFDISPAQNRGLSAVPQILAKNAEYFLGAARGFRDQGYTEVNLNLGCPSGTVTGKGKGSAMLKDADALQYFLDALYIAPPLPISIKTRIGFDDPDEWERLLPIFARYPIHELILHPRTRNQQYKGTPYREIFGKTLKRMQCPVIYNGDLFAASHCRELMEEYPDAPGIMLGRGLLSNPALLRELKGGKPLEKEDLFRFHDHLFRAYLKYWPEGAAVGKMHIFLKYFCHCLDVSNRCLREAMKANRPQEYQDAAGELFESAVLKENPRFSWGE